MLLYKYLPISWTDDLSVAQTELFQKRCNCIRDNLFWFAKPALLNDPYDCKPFFTHLQNLEIIKAILEDMEPNEITLVLEKFPNCKTKEDIYILYEKIINSLNSSTKNLAMWWLQTLAATIVNVKIANIGILSFTTNPRSILMWAQYANNHTGICLECDIPEDTRSLKKVCYTDQQPQFAIHEAMNERHGRLIDLFYTKSKHWKHEDEWRMVGREGNVSKEIPGAVINRIIYGINTSNETKEKITESIKTSIPTNQLKIKRNYSLDYVT
jgi:hypothetical protein